MTYVLIAVAYAAGCFTPKTYAKLKNKLLLWIASGDD